MSLTFSANGLNFKSSDARTGAAFIRFVNDSLSSAITSLWPESKSMALPIFLSENRFFDALKV